MPGARYLLQFDLLGLEDVQHPAALDLREILPEVELGVGVAEQADLGQSLLSGKLAGSSSSSSSSGVSSLAGELWALACISASCCLLVSIS